MDPGVSEPIVVRVRLFAMLREGAGSGTLELELEPGTTVEQALRRLAEERPVGELLRRLPLRTAVNREYADGATVLEAGDELAVIPPVSGGGQARVHARVTGDPLSAERVRRLVDDPGAGAVVVFEGVTREVPALEYEAYARDGRAGDRARAAGVRRAARAAGGRCRAPHRPRRTRRAQRDRRGLRRRTAAKRSPARARRSTRSRQRAPIWKREHRGEGAGEWVEGAVPRPALRAEHERDEAAEAGLDRSSS